MSNEKFTPGEWHRAVNMSRNGKTARGFSPCRIKSAKGIIVAFTVPQKSRQEQIANTNLIAAAPEMYRNNEQTLTELEQMIPAMLAVCADCQHRQCKVCQFAKVLKTASEMERRIEQVQKKARGEE